MYLLRRRKRHVGLLIISLLNIVMGLYAFNIPEQQKQQAAWVTHTHEVLNQLELLSSHLTQAETGQRGYLLTGQSVYLQSYSLALQRTGSDIAQIQQLTRDNPLQQAEIPLLREHVAAARAALQASIDLRLSLHTQAALDVVLSGRCGQQMEAVQQQIERMHSHEQHLRSLRIARWYAAATQTRWIFLSAVITLYGLLGIIYTIMQKEVGHRRRLLEIERHATHMQREEAERLSSIVAIQRDVASVRRGLQTTMQTIAERTQEITRAEGGVIELIEGDEMVYRAVSGTLLPHLGLRLKAATSLSGRCVRENALFKCDDAETDDRVDKAACRKVAVRSMVVVPLQSTGQAIGALKVMSGKPNAFTEQDVATLELLAGVLSVAMNDAVVSQALRDSQQRLEAANECLVDANTLLETQIAQISAQRIALETQKSELETSNARFEALASTDGLTGLKNHRAFQERIAAELERAARYTSSFSVLLVDVDHFKSFNDTFGHPAGDTVLIHVAEALQGLARSTDLAARYGGEEFVLVLPETNGPSAMRSADRIRDAIAARAWNQRAVTVSIGVATFPQQGLTARTLIDMADKALYHSKNHGRNRVTHASDIAPFAYGLREDRSPLPDNRSQELAVVPRETAVSLIS